MKRATRSLTLIGTLAAILAIPSALSAATCEGNGPPQIGAQMDPATIREDNHRYVEVTAILAVADDGAGVVVTLVSAESSDPDTGTGQGDKPNDIIQLDLDSFLVRAELGKRSTSRTYTFTYRATDACGATDEASGTVTVAPRG